MVKHRFVVALAASAIGVGSTTEADIIVDQQPDFRGFSPSEQGTAVPFARTADDFSVPNDKSFLLEVVVWMVVSHPEQPMTFGLELYLESSSGGPGQFLGDPFPVIETIDRGAWNGRDDLRLIEVHFDGLDTNLGRTTYWLSPYAIGNGGGNDRSFWATSGGGELNGSEGYFMSEHFGVPDWTPISDSGILDFPTDFAFRIDAVIPAPGITATLGVLGLIGVAGRSRRRGT